MGTLIIFLLCVCMAQCDIPFDWQIRINQSQMVFSPTMTNDINLMPSIANGCIFDALNFLLLIHWNGCDV